MGFSRTNACCLSPVMLPAYSLNRTYALFFVVFSVIGEGAASLMLSSFTHAQQVSHQLYFASWQEPTVL